MRSASTQDITDLLKRKLKSSNCKAECVLQYDNSGTWTDVDDLDVDRGIDWKKSSKRTKYANFGLTPLASSYGFQINNINGKFSPGSGETEEGIFDLDTRMRLKAGYRLPGISATSTLNVNINDSEAFLFYMKYNASVYIELDKTHAAATTDIYFQDLFGTTYDSETYDDSTYTPAGYFLTTHDFEGDDYVSLKTVEVTCNNTKGTIYWRNFNDRAATEATQRDSTDWNNGGATVNGMKEVTISGDQRYIQVAVVFDSVSWADDIRLNSIAVDYESEMEFVYYDVFYLDTPQFTDPGLASMPKVVCKGRDVFKRAIEKSINLQDLTGGVTLTQLIKDICDTINIPYTNASIADLSAFGNRTLATGLADDQNQQPKKVVDIFELIMQIINQGSTKYQMYVEYDSTEDDNILFVQPKPSTYEATFVFAYQHYKSIGGKRRNYDKLLQRMTVLTESQVPNEDEQLDQQTYTTIGAKTLSWAGNAEYKRYTIESLSGDTSVVTLTETNPTNMKFNIAATGAVNVKITIDGDKFRTTDPTFEGEAIDHNNMVNDKGITTRLINPLALSDNECRDMAEGFVGDFGTPTLEANNLRYPYLNLLPEINDMDLIWSRWTYTDDLYFITSVKYHWDKKARPSDSTSFNLDDSGLNFSDIGAFIHDDIMDYDIGYVTDMTHGVAATQAEAEAAYNVINNIGYV